MKKILFVLLVISPTVLLTMEGRFESDIQVLAQLLKRHKESAKELQDKMNENIRKALLAQKQNDTQKIKELEEEAFLLSQMQEGVNEEIEQVREKMEELFSKTKNGS